MVAVDLVSKRLWLRSGIAWPDGLVDRTGWNGMYHSAARRLPILRIIHPYLQKRLAVMAANRDSVWWQRTPGSIRVRLYRNDGDVDRPVGMRDTRKLGVS